MDHIDTFNPINFSTDIAVTNKEVRVGATTDLICTVTQSSAAKFTFGWANAVSCGLVIDLIILFEFMVQNLFEVNTLRNSLFRSTKQNILQASPKSPLPTDPELSTDMKSHILVSSTKAEVTIVHNS